MPEPEGGAAGARLEKTWLPRRSWLRSVHTCLEMTVPFVRAAGKNEGREPRKGTPHPEDKALAPVPPSRAAPHATHCAARRVVSGARPGPQGTCAARRVLPPPASPLRPPLCVSPGRRDPFQPSVALRCWLSSSLWLPKRSLYFPGFPSRPFVLYLPRCQLLTHPA